MRVLVIEDDSKIASFVVNGLKQNGFAVDHAADGEKGLALAGAVTYDAAVLDIMLPNLTAFHWCASCGRKKSTRRCLS